MDFILQKRHKPSPKTEKKMKLNSIRSLLLLLSVGILLPLNAQLKPREIDQLVEEAMEKFTVAGMIPDCIDNNPAVASMMPAAPRQCPIWDFTE